VLGLRLDRFDIGQGVQVTFGRQPEGRNFERVPQ
jgi:hypothetical protein